MDTVFNAINMNTTPVLKREGELVSITVKGTWTGDVYALRWPEAYGKHLYENNDNSPHIGVIEKYDAPFEGNDTSGGDYYYMMATKDNFSGTAYVNIP